MVSKSRSLKRIVYLISPNKIYPNFFIDLEKVLSSKHVSFFQLRLKNNNKNQIIKIAKKIKPITKKFKVKFLINDTNFLITFSYGRALQQSALKTWAKEMSDKKAIHNVFNHRAKMNGLASKGEWSQSLEA